MQIMVVISLVTVTSIGGYLVGRSLLGLSKLHLGSALRQTMQYLGMSLVFALANLLIGAAAIVIFRETTGTFISLYLVDDATLILASLLQGIVFGCWCQLGVGGEAAGGGS